MTWDNIPQEKFDNLGAKLSDVDLGNRVDIKQVKNLKIKYIDIQDFKNIEAISTELEDWNVIGGFNGEGKTSFVESIFTALLGNKFYGKGKIPASSLVRNGEKKAVIKLLAEGGEQELIVERIFTNKSKDSKLEATLNGNKIQQSDLDYLISALTLDPMKLGQGSPKDQLDTIKGIINLDTSEIDKTIENTQTRFTEANSYQKQATAIYDNFIASGVPQKVEKKNLQDLLKRKESFYAVDLKKEEYKRQAEKIETIKTQIAKLQEQLTFEEPILEKIKQEGIQLKNSLNGTLEEINQEINEIEKNNQEFDKYNKYLELKENVLKNEKDFDKVKDELEKLRDKRREVINSSGLPEYIELTEEGIFVEGIKYDLLNTARKIEIGIDLVLLSGSPLRLIRIENGGEFDTKTLEKIKDKIIKNNFQIFIERPIIDKYDSIIIEDGSILNPNN